MCSANNCCKDNVNMDFSIIFPHYDSGVTTSVDTALTLARCRCVVPVYGGRRLPLHGAGVLSQSMEDGSYPCTVPVCCPSLWRTALSLARCWCVVPVYGGRLLPLHGAGVLSQSMEDGAYPCTVPVCCPSLWRTALTLARCRCVVPVYGGRLAGGAHRDALHLVWVTTRQQEATITLVVTGDTKRVGGGAEEAMAVALLRWRATVQHCNDNTKRVGGGAEEAMAVGLLRWRATVQHGDDGVEWVGVTN